MKRQLITALIILSVSLAPIASRIEKTSNNTSSIAFNTCTVTPTPGTDSEAD